jgi:predicted Zn-dependent protease
MFIISACSRNPVTGKREIVLMSESQEINMGKSYDPQVQATYGVYDDPKLQTFITAKGKEMAAISHRPHLPYEFKVVDSPVVNAFAVPGGFVYFTRGIMAHFNNEAEFAGVLGHEIGHITARHSVQQQTKQMFGQLLFIGGLIVSEDFRNFADLASQGMGLLFLKFGRDDESQSDELGVDYSSEVGYDAVEMAGFFNTLKRMRVESGQAIPTFMSTHPDPGDRFNKVQEMAREEQQANPNKQYKINRDSYLKMIDGMIYGEDPRQGYTENGAFYHPELLFQFPVPSGWRVNNMPAQVQMSPEDGNAILTMDLAAGTDLRAAANTFVQENKLTVIEQSSSNVNGNNAYTLIAESTPTQANGGQEQAQSPTLRMLTYFISYGGKIYKFNGLSKKTDFNKYFSSFQRSMKNFKKLTDQSKINKKPITIAIKTVKQNSTLQTALTSYSMQGPQLKELAILNGMELTDQVRAGSLIKTLGTLGGGAAVPTSNSGGDNSNSGTDINTNTNNPNTGSTNSDGGIKNNKTGTSGTKTTKSGGTKIGSKGKLKKKKKD